MKISLLRIKKRKKKGKKSDHCDRYLPLDVFDFALLVFLVFLFSFLFSKEFTSLGLNVVPFK